MQGIFSSKKITTGRNTSGQMMFLLCLAVCASLLISMPLEAKESAGNVLRVTGKATITSTDGQIREVEKNTKIASTDIISTSARSYVRMKLNDDSYIMVRPDSRMSVDDFKYDRKKQAENRGLFSLLKGGFRVLTGLISDKKKYKYQTSVATLGIRGTEFSVRVCNADCYDVDPVPENGLFLEVLDQEVIITTRAGVYTFSKGQYAYVASSDSPAILLDGIPDVFAQSPIPPANPADCEQ